MALHPIPDKIHPRNPMRKFSISLRWLMVLGFGMLVAVSVGLVLFLSLKANITNTVSLLNARAVLMLDSMERSIRSETDQAERVVRAVASLFEENGLSVGPLDKTQRETQQTALKSLMVASPVVQAILVYDLEGHRTGLFHNANGKYERIPFGLGDKNEIDALLKSRERGQIDGTQAKPVWGEPVRLGNTLFHNVAMPLIKSGKVRGVAVAAIGQKNMNRIVGNLGKDFDVSVFVLTHDDKVIAHSRQPDVFNKNGSIPILEFPDPVLWQLNDAQPVRRFGVAKNDNTKVYQSKGSGSEPGHIFLIHTLVGYSALPYRLGVYFSQRAVGTEFQRVMISALAGLGALILAVIAAMFLSRHLSKPMKKIAKIANDFSELKLENFEHLPASRIREINEQSRAMNSMHNALSEFAHYVPRSIVKQLMAPGSDSMASFEREISIMFADIVGFTKISENLDAAQTAALLNGHFDRVCQAISAHNGTIDKFIGDGILAFWGAPEADDNHAGNAIAAALELTARLEIDNAKRNQQGRPQLLLRVGIHTGRAVVGNIGSCERQNYTIVGDAVNVANRLEEFGRDYLGEAQSVISISAQTWRTAGSPNEFVSIGLQNIRGREKPIEIFLRKSGTDAVLVDPGSRPNN